MENIITLEVNGQEVQLPEGASLMDAATKAKAYVPHFCYHKKLSIAANCRMCLVEVEKAPKPLPACATLAAKGMKVFTHSDIAVKAQKGVMEFLLINHPLDCPICDQGGECQLQDLSVGYGGSSSRFSEEKRVVFNKDIGPLITTEMTRCINCTRCVRFTDEIAGEMELGQLYRGDRAEITSFIEKSIHSELSGNVIDLCPVGALTSKPFRFRARNWELSSSLGISPHDSIGSNLMLQTRNGELLRVLPQENHEINECWLSDKDRFSYEALKSEDRLTSPMLLQNDQWEKVEWHQALDIACAELRKTASGTEDVSDLACLVSPHATVEEMTLAHLLLKSLGSDNIDFRLRSSDEELDSHTKGTPWLGMKIADISQLDSALIVGSFLNKDHPLLANRFRQSEKKGASLHCIGSSSNHSNIKFDTQVTLPPSLIAQNLETIIEKIEAKQFGNDALSVIAQSLISGKFSSIFLGNLVRQAPNATEIHLLCQKIATLTNSKLGVLGEAAGSVGGYVSQCHPQTKLGLSTKQIISREKPFKVIILINVDPELDTFDGAQTLECLSKAETVIAITPFASPRLKNYADLLLPSSCFSESCGTYINIEGRIQTASGVSKLPGEARPGWKIITALGKMLDSPEFDIDTAEEALMLSMKGKSENGFVTGLDNFLSSEKELGRKMSDMLNVSEEDTLERVSNIPIYESDQIVRRAKSLQKTQDASAPRAYLNQNMLKKYQLSSGEMVDLKVTFGPNKIHSLSIDCKENQTVPDNCIQIAAGHIDTVAIGPMFSKIVLSKRAQ